MKSPFDSALTGLLIGTILLHLTLAPFTKVEESFNIQATHDIITSGVSFANRTGFLKTSYDHVEFPGSVPRTFVGALFLSGIAKVLQFVADVKDGEDSQFLVRGILGLITAASLLSFRKAIAKTFGTTTGNWFVLIQASQFHVMYYASRTLPNMYAFALTNLAFGAFVLAMNPPQQQSKLFHSRTIFLTTFAGVIFRSELAVLVFTIAAFVVTIHGPRSLTSVFDPPGIIIPPGIGGAILGLITTVSIDSYFWNHFPIWPEWSSFYYNTILGKSSDWGVSPWHFYFTNALPRLLLNPLAYLLLIPLALAQPATRSRSLALLLPSLGFVALYSLLPHKEWRFIIYIIPALTAVSAIGASWIWTRRTKSLFYRSVNAILVSSIVASFMASAAFSLISSLNYPGGDAIVRLRSLTYAEPGSQRIYVDNLACQTGVTRFLESRSTLSNTGLQKWTFDKTENQTMLLSPPFWDRFDYAIVENVERTIGKWEVVDTVNSFAGVKVVKPGDDLGFGNGESSILQYWDVIGMLARGKLTKGWWVTLKLEPKLRILKRQRTSVNADVEEGVEMSDEVV
ncbi:glycosyltransferase family 22 protein [Venturia nashicola]|uniref:Mannosyltransferase n=1 Tax=Venturia nashicola TaxID=86259 RepID=A0A4Z1NVM3_9PEZI|nr:glycosyltransferase family 22 protein [Venturia nashicola]